MMILARSVAMRPGLSTMLALYSNRSLISTRSAALSLRHRLPSSTIRTGRFLTAVSMPEPSFRRFRSFSSISSHSSITDPSPNWSNRPPKETILLDGCDYEHWLIVMEPPENNPTRDEIIDSYIKTLATVLESEEEARMSIYSVSTKHYFAFGCKISEELSYKLKPLPNVRWVLPDSYLDVKAKSYGGEPFIDGKAVPYDPKYHEEWVRNNAKANERSRHSDRPRNFDRSRNFERRRENMQQARESSYRPPPPRDSNVQSGPPPPRPSNFQSGPPPPRDSNVQSGPPPPRPSNFQSGPPPPRDSNVQSGPPPPRDSNVQSGGQ